MMDIDQIIATFNSDNDVDAGELTLAGDSYIEILQTKCTDAHDVNHTVRNHIARMQMTRPWVIDRVLALYARFVRIPPLAHVVVDVPIPVPRLRRGITLEERLHAQLADAETKLEAAQRRIDEVEEERDRYRSRFESDDFGWSAPRAIDDRFIGLPMPRLELHWEVTDGYRFDTRCTYMFVYPHFLDDAKRRHIVGKPLGQTKSHGSCESKSFIRGRCIDTPFRESAHATHDAKLLKLPLYVTTSDGDAALIDPETHQQTLILVSGDPK